MENPPGDVESKIVPAAATMTPFGDAGPLPCDAPYELSTPYGGEPSVWTGWVSGNLTPGTDRFLYGGEWFMPLYQNDRTLWYFDFRGQGDDNSASEFNAGTGVRTLTDPGWIVGGYAFWDHLRSTHGNTFNQGTVGLEAMNVAWDVRGNAYFPETEGQVAGTPSVDVSGGNLVVHSGFERAYWGTDFEVGRLLAEWGPNSQQEIRGFVGVYHFDHNAASTPAMTGPRARFEYRCYDLPWLGSGSRLSAGVTMQTDDVRDEQLFAFARLRVPIDPLYRSRKPLSPLRRRMLDRVVRDVDVVTDAQQRSEGAVNPITGRAITGITTIDAETENTAEIINELDPDSLIIIDGSQGDLQFAHSFQLKPGQMVLGGGQSFMVQGQTSRQHAMFHAAGERPLIDFAQQFEGTFFANNDVAFGTLSPPFATSGDLRSYAGFLMADDTQLVGVDIQRALGGVIVNEAENVLVNDVEITDFLGNGIDVVDSQNVTLNNVRVLDSWQGPYFTTQQGDIIVAVGPWSANGYFSLFNGDRDRIPYGVGIRVTDSSEVAITDSQVEGTLGEGIRAAWSQDIVIQNTSIRDTVLDGIRLRDTENVAIDQVEMENVGESYWHPVNGSHNGYAYALPAQLIGGISMQNTLNTQVTNTTILHSKGVGIVADNAEETLLENLDIQYAEHGVLFQGGSDVWLTDSSIVLKDEEHRASRASRARPGYGYTADVWTPDHAGALFENVSGTVVVAGNTIRGGYRGAGVGFSGQGDSSTNLAIVGNHIEKLGDWNALIEIESSDGHNLDAQIAGNVIKAEGNAFELSMMSAGEQLIKIHQNSFENGKLVVDLLGGTADVTITGNHLGGDPMGRILADPDSVLNLKYNGNTSGEGAAVMEFHNQTPDFIVMPEGNDHEPAWQYAHGQ